MKTWHKRAFILAGLLTVASFAIAIYSWGKLPALIPTHFGFNGAPDAWSTKSIWDVYLIPTVQILILALLSFLYYKPQYSDMPTTLLLLAMEKDDREHAFGLIRTMMAVLVLWISVLFTFITYMITSSSLNQSTGYLPYIMITIIGGMLVWLVWYTVKVYRVTKELILKKGNKDV